MIQPIISKYYHNLGQLRFDLISWVISGLIIIEVFVFVLVA